LKVKLVCLADFVSENRIRHIDLMKVNIEGGEYDLLEHVIATGLIHRVENIQVQFHDFFPDAVRRMAKIHDELTKTHYLTYQYRFVWENWRLKRGTQTS
jgi:cell wall assembly regulator SMI1